MFGFFSNKTKVSSLQLAAYLLKFVTLDNQDPGLLPMLQRGNPSACPPSELFCLKYFVLMVALRHTLGGKALIHDSMVSILSDLHLALYGYDRLRPEERPGTEFQRARVTAFLCEALERFQREDAEEYAEMIRMRSLVPSPTMLADRFVSLSAAFDSGHGAIEAGFQAIANTTATHLGAGGDPLVYTSLRLAMAPLWATVKVIPQYRIVLV